MATARKIFKAQLVLCGEFAGCFAIQVLVILLNMSVKLVDAVRPILDNPYRPSHILVVLVVYLAMCPETAMASDNASSLKIANFNNATNGTNALGIAPVIPSDSGVIVNKSSEIAPAIPSDSGVNVNKSSKTAPAIPSDPGATTTPASIPTTTEPPCNCSAPFAVTLLFKGSSNVDPAVLLAVLKNLSGSVTVQGMVNDAAEFEAFKLSSTNFVEASASTFRIPYRMVAIQFNVTYTGNATMTNATITPLPKPPTATVTIKPSAAKNLNMMVYLVSVIIVSLTLILLCFVGYTNGWKCNCGRFLVCCGICASDCRASLREACGRARDLNVNGVTARFRRHGSPAANSDYPRAGLLSNEYELL